MVKVPVRNKFILSIVTRTRDVKSAKSDIRRAGFLLKKIRKSDILEVNIPKETLEAVTECAKYYATNVGSLFSTLLPKVMQDNPQIFLKQPQEVRRKIPKESRETILLQMETEERFAQYRALVRQSFARNASVVFVVPSHLDISRTREELSKGISEFVHVWTLSNKKDQTKKTWTKALNDPHPILFITTAAGLFFPRADIDTIIIERENSRAYRTFTRPFIHFKVLVELLSKKANKQLVMGDSVLSLETLWRERSGEYGESSLIRWRLPAVPTSLVDALTKQNENGRFEIFSSELKVLLEKALREKGRIFLFGARKGLSPNTVCGDCGTVLQCLNCGAGVVLHRQGEATVYICHACGSRRESSTSCGYCGSWKLVPLGIGTEQIARTAKDLFPRTPIQILDKDYATTDKQAQEIVNKFKASGGILVGTELAFYHVDQVDFSALVSVDALFSIPDFGINERIFYLVSRLREMTKVEALIQTRNIGKQILAWASTGNIIDFYQDEVEERRNLLYPPFSIFIKIEMERNFSTPARLKQLKEEFKKWEPDVLKNSLIIRIPREKWPDQDLVERLSLLGVAFSIKVDPESIL